MSHICARPEAHTEHYHGNGRLCRGRTSSEVADSPTDRARRDIEAVIAEALVRSHDTGDCPHADVDGDTQCPDCDAHFVAQALLDARWLDEHRLGYGRN